MTELPTITDDPGIGRYDVLVNFGAGIDHDQQGRVLLAMERSLREAGIPANVFKARRGDDSQLRRAMTEERRSNL